MSYRTLIVEDERIIAEDIKNALISFGYEVLAITGSGEEAWKLAQELKPDIVLMDIVLEGEINGLDAGRKIYHRLGIPIIFLTSYADEKTLEKAKSANPYAYLVKPFEDKELHASLEMALYKNRMEKLLHDSEKKYRHLVESIGEGIIILNRKCSITFANNAAASILGLSKRELLGKNLKGFILKAELHKFEKKFAELAAGHEVRLDISVRSHNTRERILDLQMRPLYDKENFSGIFTVFNDITGRKELEIKLIKSEKELNREVKELKSKLDRNKDIMENLGDSEQIRRVLKQVNLVAKTDMSVIIEGKSGTGKEVIANMIHRLSKRRNQPLIAIDCGAIPVTLIESEMFGYEKGAFTGADTLKSGKFELASKGTLLLDEVTNLPPEGQRGLLRALEERIIYRVGGKKPIPVDVRIISTSNLDLGEAVRSGTFREDLFHRLNEFRIVLPTLKERKNDIETLTRTFLNLANRELGKNVVGINVEALKLLHGYDWPGNIRELKHLIRRAVLVAEHDILTPEDLQFHCSLQSGEIIPAWSQTDLDRILEANCTLNGMVTDVIRDLERKIIVSVLKKVNFNKTKAARILGIDRSTLYSKLKQMGII
ncbi:MAG: sigma 54-interacting transcriptional regulator [Candidatus Cloacimonetes bacterium]|nr:sigma 54-interacting transcriptional regulator [Candidatus Cloacimonadota bacterium]